MNKRYAIVVKEINNEMIRNVFGFTSSANLKKNTLFSFTKERESCHGYLCAAPEYMDSWPFIIPLEWCLELTEHEYKIFKKLEGIT